MMNWGNLFAHAANTFYTEFLLQLTALLVIITYFNKRNKTKDLRYLVIIAIASLVECLVSDYDFLTLEKFMSRKTGGLILLTYVVIEFVCCLLFIRANILSRLVKKIVLLSPIALLGYYIIRIVNNYHKPVNRPNSNINLSDMLGFIVIVFSLYFFYELFAQNSNKIKHTQSATWAISGMLILFSSIAPLFIFLGYFLTDDKPLMNSLWAINNIAYSIMFVTFTIAIRCSRVIIGSNT